MSIKIFFIIYINMPTCIFHGVPFQIEKVLSNGWGGGHFNILWKALKNHKRSTKVKVCFSEMCFNISLKRNG